MALSSGDNFLQLNQGKTKQLSMYNEVYIDYFLKSYNLLS